MTGELDTALLRVDEANYLGKTVPDVSIVTKSGSEKLFEIMDGQPTVLVLSYYTCGHVCPLTVQNLSRLRIDADAAGYRVVILSFDVKDTLQTMASVTASLDEVPDNWTFGLLPAAESERLTESVGFKFFFSERDQTFVHPSVLTFLSPEGEVMRYLYGTEPREQDVELALIESRNREPYLNEIVDMVALTCYQFDATGSRYVLHPTLIFGAAGIGVLGLCGLATLASRKDSRGDS